MIAGEGAFVLPGAVRDATANRIVDVEHIRLQLRPDLLARTLDGVCTLTLSAFDAPLSTIEFDAVEMNVTHVADAGGPLDFIKLPRTLIASLRTPLDLGERLEIAVTYRIEQPRRGLYFTGGDRDPQQPRQCWTHGHAGGARYWFPCIDRPDQLQTSTIEVELDAGLFALANGELRERRDTATRSIFVYEHRHPHTASLFSMVAGAFVEFAQTAGSVPVNAYVAPGREADGVRTFGRTPEMLAALERFTGAPYPFARYSQIAVADYPFIGMENTTASTISDDWMLDARALATPAVESLVVHELAHQWFGNLVTTTQWSDVWLHEGFASYCEAVWDEASNGWDAYAYNIFRQWRTYADEARSKYTRPIICHRFRDPIDLFDKHLYEKAGVMLHMLRGTLGERHFARAIARYVADNARAGVETVDFVRAIEAASGRNLRVFFDRWARRSGHPIVTVTLEPDGAHGTRIRCTQRQPIDDAHPAYRFTLVIGVLDVLPDELASNCGPGPLPGERRFAFEMDAAQCVFSLPGSAPALVRVDPGAWTLGDFSLELGTEFCCASLARDPDPIARIRAAQTLARDGSTAARQALATALAGDPFWGARVECATLLGGVRAGWARTALLRALADPDPHVRRAVCAALGAYPVDEVTAALRGVVASESASEAVGEALHALGKTRDPAVAATLNGALHTSSWADGIGSGALAGLAEIGDASALATIQAALGEAAPRRQSAIRALAIVAVRSPSERVAIIATIVEMLADPSAMTRLQAVASLDLIAEPSSGAELERMARTEPIPWVRSHADRAAIRARSGLPRGGPLEATAAELMRMREEHARLSERVDRRSPPWSKPQA